MSERTRIAGDALSRRILDLERQLAEAQEREARLLDFLEEAVDLISEFHGRPGWTEYQSSPEMQRFRAALAPPGQARGKLPEESP